MDEGASLDFPGAIPETRGEESEWFAFCREDRLMIQQCVGCGSYHFYPRGACLDCLTGTLAWVEAVGTGTVFTYTIQHRFPPGFAGDPYVLAMIELDEGVRMMSRVVAPPASVYVGMPVEVAFATVAGEFRVPVFLPGEDA